MNSWRARVDSGVARGKLCVLDNGMGEQDAARPSHPRMAVVFRDVERYGLRGEESQVDE